MAQKNEVCNFCKCELEEGLCPFCNNLYIQPEEDE